MLREAAGDLTWLSNRGYPPAAAQKLVGDRYQLAAGNARPWRGCVCSDTERIERNAARCRAKRSWAGRSCWTATTSLTTVEAALAAG